jgi:hypothetical protein
VSLRLFQRIACWLGLAAVACAGEAPAVIDCHVHLWDIARPAGLGWITKDDKTLNRSFLPADHELIARANGVSGIIVVQACQSLPDNQWNLDITAHNPRLYRGLRPPHSPPPGKHVGNLMGYHLRQGPHAITPEDWKHYLDFADQWLRKRAADNVFSKEREKLK